MGSALFISLTPFGHHHEAMRTDTSRMTLYARVRPQDPDPLPETAEWILVPDTLDNQTHGIRISPVR